jgi:hypothetical protein
MKQSATHAALSQTPAGTRRTAQSIPLDAALHALVDAAGSHTWQGFPGFTAPEA